jgi:hypothetical protein
VFSFVLGEPQRQPGALSVDPQNVGGLAGLLYPYTNQLSETLPHRGLSLSQAIVQYSKEFSTIARRISSKYQQRSELIEQSFFGIDGKHQKLAILGTSYIAWKIAHDSIHEADGITYKIDFILVVLRIYTSST